VQAADPDVESAHVSTQQEHAIKDRGGEGVDMAGDVREPGGSAEHATEVGARIAPLFAAAEQEVRRDRVQQQPRQPAAGAQADPAQQPHREPAAPLAALLPAVHASATSPEATSVASRSTRKRQRGAAPVSSTRATSPGSSGLANFTCGMRNGPGGPCTASIAASTWSRITTPGTSGRPGK